MAVYFVQADDGPIKIGSARSVTTRVEGLQTATHRTLTLLAQCDGDSVHEKILHRKFAHAHICREWFSPEADLLALIEHVAATGELPADVEGPVPVPDTSVNTFRKYLLDNGWNQTVAAARLGMSEAQISRVLNGSRAIGELMALRVERATADLFLSGRAIRPLRAAEILESVR